MSEKTTSVLKIGAPDTPSGRRIAELTRAELANAGIEARVDLLSSELEAALLSGEVDAIAAELNQCPTRQPEGMVITALSRRDNPADGLLIRQEAVQVGKIFRLKEGASVGCRNLIQKAQLLDYRPDIVVTAISDDTAGLLEQLKSAQLDALLIPLGQLDTFGLEWNEFVKVELNPREFTPAPGQGVVAWQTHRDDIPTRQLLRQIHHPEVSALTNVERRVQQILGDDAILGVHCEQDAAGNFHVSAAQFSNGALHRAYLSQSTRAGLAERTARMMNDK
ncbi:MAG: hypothetical protein IT259_10510 [Saprospiraceae bacterium]|nr:hypothetical protein [Saprospiraceae bacterium]